MGAFFTIFVTLMLGGVLTLFSTVYIGGDPMYAAPLSVMLVTLTWISHDLLIFVCRKYPIARILMTWAYTGRMKDRLRQLGALITMLQLWSVVSLAPALLTWFVATSFSDYLAPLSLGQCFAACVFMEMFCSLALDLPSGFFGIARHMRGDGH